MSETMRRFDPLGTGLDGTNLIEASAGTGKTYTIGSLVLRLILEPPTADHPVAVTITHAAERELTKQLVAFAGAVASVADGMRPHRLCTYLFDLAQTYTAFYEQCPVLRADDEAVRASRLDLCDLTAGVLAQGLDLLGIEAPERI